MLTQQLACNNIFVDLQLAAKCLQIIYKNPVTDLQKYFYFALLIDYTGVYKAGQNSGLPWLHCKAIINWMDISSDSKWHTFGAAVSASYVEHVLNKFDIAEEMQG